MKRPVAGISLHHLKFQSDLFQLASRQEENENDKKSDVAAEQQCRDESLHEDTVKSLVVQNESTHKSKETHQKGNAFQYVQTDQFLFERTEIRLHKESDDEDGHYEKTLEIASESVGEDDDDRENGLSQEDQTIPVDVVLLENDKQESHRLLRPLGRELVLSTSAFQKNDQQKWKQDGEEKQWDGDGKSEVQMGAAEALHRRVCDPVAMRHADVFETDAIVHADAVECIDGDLYQYEIRVVADDDVGQDGSSEESVPVLVPL